MLNERREEEDSFAVRCGTRNRGREPGTEATAGGGVDLIARVILMCVDNLIGLQQNIFIDKRRCET